MNTPINDLFALAEEAIAPVIWTEKKALQKFKESATPERVLEVEKAFRALEQENILLKQGCENSPLVHEMVDWRERAEAAEAKLYRQESIIPEGLTRCTAELVMDFAKALAEKLYRSEQKYGWSDGWKESDWQDKCLADFHHHIGKGDPRDVAAYCAFMWHHEWPTRPAPAVSLAELVPDCLVDAMCKLDLAGVSIGDKAIIGKAIEVLQNIEQQNER